MLIVDDLWLASSITTIVKSEAGLIKIDNHCKLISRDVNIPIIVEFFANPSPTKLFSQLLNHIFRFFAVVHWIHHASWLWRLDACKLIDLLLMLWFMSLLLVVLLQYAAPFTHEDKCFFQLLWQLRFNGNAGWLKCPLSKQSRVSALDRWWANKRIILTYL